MRRFTSLSSTINTRNPLSSAIGSGVVLGCGSSASGRANANVEPSPTRLSAWIKIADVHDQHPQPLKLRNRKWSRIGLRVQRQRQGKRERGALAYAALRVDHSAHQFHQMLGNCQPQARTTVAPRGGGIGLAEFLEQAGEFFLCNADRSEEHTSE